MTSFLLLTCGRPYVSRSSLQFLSGHVTLSLCRDDSRTFTGRSSLCSVAFYQDFIVFLKVVKFTNELDHHTVTKLKIGELLWADYEFFLISVPPSASLQSQKDLRLKGPLPTVSCGQCIDGEVRGQMHTSRCL